MRVKYLFTTITLVLCQPAMAKSGDFFLRPVFGLSQLSDTNGLSEAVGNTGGQIDVSVDGGFNAGLGFGYHYTDQFAVELMWEYRSNDSETTLADGTRFTDGNYASNVFYLNGHYAIYAQQNWRTYLGAGLGWIQEIDIDLETESSELSYSGDGEFGYQLFAGADYRIHETLSINLELRYSKFAKSELEGEGIGGIVRDLDYDPTTVQVGLTWRF